MSVWVKIEDRVSRIEQLLGQLKTDLKTVQNAHDIELSAAVERERQVTAAEVERLDKIHDKELSALEKSHTKEIAALEKANLQEARRLAKKTGEVVAVQARSVKSVALQDDLNQRRTGKLSLPDRIRVVTCRIGRRMSREEIGYYGALSATSGPAGDAFRELVTAGSLEYTEGLYKYVKWGTGEPDPIPDLKSRTEIFADFCQRESGLVGRLAQAFVAAVRKDPDVELTKSELCDLTECSHTSGPVGDAFRRLRKLDMIELDGETKLMRLSDWFFKAAAEIQITVRDLSTGEERRVKVR